MKSSICNVPAPDAPPSASTYPLFEHMSREHGLTLVESELDEIRHAVARCGTVVPVEEAEALAKALERVLESYSYWHVDQGEVAKFKEALTAYRAKHKQP